VVVKKRLWVSRQSPGLDKVASNALWLRNFPPWCHSGDTGSCRLNVRLVLDSTLLVSARWRPNASLIQVFSFWVLSGHHGSYCLDLSLVLSSQHEGSGTILPDCRIEHTIGAG